MKATRRYHNGYEKKSLILTDELIEELINTKENLDFTGYDPSEGHSSPLTYAIYNNKKELFDKLISAGANVNYQIDDYKWSPITYAMRYQDDYFIKKLLENDKLDFNLEINGKNTVEHSIEATMTRAINGINQKDFFQRLKLLIDTIYKTGISAKNFFHLEKGKEETFYQNPTIANVFINKFPRKWLKEFFCEDITANREEFILNMLYILSEDKTSIKKLIKLLEKNEQFYDGNTILHSYVFNNNAKIKFSKPNPDIIEIFLDNGFDAKINNNKGVNVHSVLLEQEFYKKYLTIQSYIELEQKLSKNDKHIERKIKV